MATSEEVVFIEPRWPVALVVSVFVVLTVVLRALEPDRQSLGPRWLVPVAEIVMLGLLLAADPTRAVSRRHWLRPLALGSVALLAVAVLASTAKLIDEL